MEKIQITDEMLKKSKLLNSKNMHTRLFKINDEEILKVFDKYMLDEFDKTGVSLEQRVLNSKSIHPNIVIPTKAAYKGDKFVAYVMNYIEGITDTEYDDSLSLEQRCDLYKYARDYLKLEKIIKECPNVVFPDILTSDNILITNDGERKLIDFDGIQIGNTPVFNLSDRVEDAVMNKKYYDKNTQLFTKQLDIKSLTLYYFLSAFNIDLSLVGKYNQLVRRVVTLDDVFNMLNLTDVDIMHKVAKLFSREENEYLGESVLNLAEKYNLNLIHADTENQFYIKKLENK